MDNNMQYFALLPTTLRDFGDFAMMIKFLPSLLLHIQMFIYENIDLYGTYLYDNVCNSYPEYKDESGFDIKKYCMGQLNYSAFIDRFNGGIDTLLIP